ncbi:tyrosine-type recombinase/integrase [Lactococcus lactis]|uniref:tyrosine-type recombinase/integrase n=1 Tax=Lactococcus lactis TaxID=1358 RepID=UPI003562D2E5
MEGIKFSDELKVTKHRTAKARPYQGRLGYFDPIDYVWKSAVIGMKSKNREAKNLARAELEKKILEKYKQVKSKKVGTLGEALDEYLEHRKTIVSKATLFQDLTALKGLRVFRQSLSLVNVNEGHIKRVMEGWTACNEMTQLAYLNIIKNFFRKCIEKGYIVDNPAEKIKIISKKSTSYEIHKKEDKYFTISEQKRIYAAMEKYDNKTAPKKFKGNTIRYRLFLEFQALLGGRFSEQAGMKYDDVDYEKNTVYITTQLDRFSSVFKPENKEMKTPESIRIDMHISPRQVEIIKWFYEHNEHDKEYIFVKCDGSVMNVANLDKFLKNFTSVLPHKLPSSFVTHAFRASHATMLYEKGATPEAIARRLGHKGTRTTYAHYIKTTPQMMKESARILDGISLKPSKGLSK